MARPLRALRYAQSMPPPSQSKPGGKKAGSAGSEARAAGAVSAGQPGARWRVHRLPLLALFAAVLAAYSNSFQAGFVFDNRSILLEDPRIRAVSLKNLTSILTGGYWANNAAAALYRPVTTLTYLFNYAVLGGGDRPAGYHLFNLVLHAVNVALVYALAMALLGRRRFAFAVAALWALHPVLTESVTNIVGRADMLACFGVLAGLLCHVKGVEAQGRRRWGWAAALGLAAAAGVFSKESAVMVLGAMLLYDCAFGRWRHWRAAAPGYVAAVLPILLLFYARSRVFAGVTPVPVGVVDNPMIGAPFWAAQLTAIQVVGRYLLLLLWPARLSPDYSFNQIPVFAGRFDNWGDWGTIAAGALCLAALAGAAVSYRRARPFFFFLMFFFVMLGPTSNVGAPLVAIMGERFLYLPSIGFAACLVIAFSRWGPAGTGREPAFSWALAVILILLGARTFLRNWDWADDVSLWTSAVEASPQSYKVHMNLAAAWMPARPDDAIREVDRALAILEPLENGRSSSLPYVNAGRWYRREGESLGASGESASWYRKALSALQRAQGIEAAQNASKSQAGGQLPPGPSTLYLELGRTFLRLNDTSRALQALEVARRSRPGPDASQAMARAYQINGDWERAAVSLMEGLVLEPGNPGLAAELAGVYGHLDPQGCAVPTQGTFDPACPLVRKHLCTAAGNLAGLYDELGRKDESAKIRADAGSLGCPLAP